MRVAVAPFVFIKICRAVLPEVGFIHLVHIEGPESIESAIAAAEATDFVLLDSGRPSAETPELGGTGRTHDLVGHQRVVAQVNASVFLAGGLAAENVGAADPRGALGLTAGSRPAPAALGASATG